MCSIVLIPLIPITSQTQITDITFNILLSAREMNAINNMIALGVNNTSLSPESAENLEIIKSYSSEVVNAIAKFKIKKALQD